MGFKIELKDFNNKVIFFIKIKYGRIFNIIIYQCILLENIRKGLVNVGFWYLCILGFYFFRKYKR